MGRENCLSKSVSDLAFAIDRRSTLTKTLLYLGQCAKTQGVLRNVAFLEADYWVTCLSYQDGTSQGRVTIG